MNIREVLKFYSGVGLDSRVERDEGATAREALRLLDDEEAQRRAFGGWILSKFAQTCRDDARVEWTVLGPVLDRRPGNRAFRLDVAADWEAWQAALGGIGERQ